MKQRTLRQLGLAGLLAALMLPAAAHAQARQQQPRAAADAERLQSWLKRFPDADADGDGRLTMEEAREYRKRKGAAAGGRKQGVGAVPRQGTLTPERLAKLLERFPEADTDRDGKLSPEEAKTHWAGRQKQRAGAAPGAAQGGARYTGLPPDHADVAYGPDPANVLDLWRAKSETPAPLVIYIHGGGFRSGDKRKAAGQALSYVREGIAFASINYRMLPEHRFPTPLHDSARAVQFLRSKAKEWNIDPDHVACTGGSAGAGTSLWIAFHDDLADPDNADPVLRESSRITCAAVGGAQTSYDPRFCEKHGLNGLRKHASYLPLYGMSEDADEFSPELIAEFEAVSPIHHLTQDDPPVMLTYGEPNHPREERIEDGRAVHHPRFGIILKEQMVELGIECVLKYRGHTDPECPPDTTTTQLDFLKRHLGVE